jgi:hypothetical protein
LNLSLILEDVKVLTAFTTFARLSGGFEVLAITTDSVATASATVYTAIDPTTYMTANPLTSLGPPFQNSDDSWPPFRLGRAKDLGRCVYSIR